MSGKKSVRNVGNSKMNSRKKRFAAEKHLDNINGTDFGTELNVVHAKAYHNYMAAEQQMTLETDDTGGGGGGGGTPSDQPPTDKTPSTDPAAYWPAPQTQIDSWDCPTLQAKISEWQSIKLSARLTAPAAQGYSDAITYAQNRYNNSCIAPVVPIVQPPAPSSPAANQNPIAVAGDAQTIQLPTNSVTLDGSRSYDPDQTQISFSWSLISGPNIPNVVGANKAVATVSNLIEGQYTFRLSVSDMVGASDSSTVNVTVLPASVTTPPQQPTTPISIDADNNNIPGNPTTVQATAPVLTQISAPYITSQGAGAPAGASSKPESIIKSSYFNWLILYAVAATVYIVFEKND